MIIAKDYHIEMLSVGAADAFILYVIDNQDKGHLILIDAGNYNDGDKIIKHIRKYYSNPRLIWPLLLIVMMIIMVVLLECWRN